MELDTLLLPQSTHWCLKASITTPSVDLVLALLDLAFSVRDPLYTQAYTPRHGLPYLSKTELVSGLVKKSSYVCSADFCTLVLKSFPIMPHHYLIATDPPTEPPAHPALELATSEFPALRFHCIKCFASPGSRPETYNSAEPDDSSTASAKLE